MVIFATNTYVSRGYSRRRYTGETGESSSVGAIYGLLLMIPAMVWAIIWIDIEPKQLAMTIGMHLVYGLVLGAWLGLGV